MKRLLILSFSFLAVFSSCKKSSSSANSGSYVTATVNGSNLTFNVGAAAYVQNSSGGYSLEITGHEGVALDASQIIISIGGANPITAGAYPNGTTAADQVSMEYALTDVATYSATAYLPSVTITSISSTNVQGTFNGVLTLTSGSAPASTATITNGKFNVGIN